MKFLKIFGISLGVLFLLLLIAPFLFKGKIVAAVKSATNEQLNATLSFNENIGLSLISSFPNLSLTINEITLINKAPFLGDTLFATKEFNAVLDIMSVINGEQINIRKVFLDQPKIYAATLPDGSANWDIALADSTASQTLEDTASSAFSLKLNDNCDNNDTSLNTYGGIGTFFNISIYPKIILIISFLYLNPKSVKSTVTSNV